MNLELKIIEVKKLLQSAHENYVSIVFASSFSAEDMVLTDLIGRHYPGIRIFTLDTGRLPEETHSLIKKWRTIIIFIFNYITQTPVQWKSILHKMDLTDFMTV